jgi:toxin-antitoxin system PIN domain toxin
MFAVDTNVLVYAAVEACPEHAVCLDRLQRLRQGPIPWFTTWPILYETLRVLTHRRALQAPWKIERAVGFVNALLASPTLQILVPTAQHASVLAVTIDEVPGLGGSVVHDLHTAVLMREHGIRRIVTRDADFHRFQFLEVVDPLGSGWPEEVRERPVAASRPGRRRTAATAGSTRRTHRSP